MADRGMRVPAHGATGHSTTPHAHRTPHRHTARTPHGGAGEGVRPPRHRMHVKNSSLSEFPKSSKNYIRFSSSASLSNQIFRVARGGHPTYIGSTNFYQTY